MYIFQCMYFGLSAYQVRCGYPIRILGNFLTKSYTLTSGMLFQGYIEICPQLQMIILIFVDLIIVLCCACGPGIFVHNREMWRGDALQGNLRTKSSISDNLPSSQQGST